MIDIRLIRENPDLVRENIRKKFQDAKLPLVDEVIELDKANRAAINEASNLRAERNALSKKIGMLMGQAKKDPSRPHVWPSLKSRRRNSRPRSTRSCSPSRRSSTPACR